MALVLFLTRLVLALAFLWGWLGNLALPQHRELPGGMIVLGVLAVTLWLLWHVLHQQRRRLEAVETRLAEAGHATQGSGAPLAGLEVGTPAPAFSLTDVDGEARTLQDLLERSKLVLLLFVGPGCKLCEALLPEVGRWQRNYAEKLTLAVVSRGGKEVNQNKASAYGLEQVLLQEDREVQAAYQVTRMPSLVLIRPDGTIGSRLAQRANDIHSLVGSALGLSALRTLPMVAAPHQPHGNETRPQPVAPAVGEPAPDFILPDLVWKPVRLSDFRGSLTLVLFWRPGCGFCQRMLPDLKAWEQQPPDGAPRLLVVSSESVESNRAMGLRSPVLLDQISMSVGSTFGAIGTPMAILIDEEGKIASQLATGAPAVMAMAGRRLGTIASV